MNNLGDFSNQKAINHINVTLDLLGRGMSYDKNLKLLPKNSTENKASPVEIITKIFDVVKDLHSLDPQTCVDRDTWQKLVEKTDDFLESSNFSIEEKNQVNNVFDQIILHARDDSDQYEDLSLLSQLKNVYYDLDNLFLNFNKGVFAIQIASSYLRLSKAGIIPKLSFHVINDPSKTKNIKVDHFTLDYQTKKVKLTPDVTNSLNSIFENIDAISANKGLVDINFVEDLVKQILQLKLDNKSLAKTCDQLIQVLDFMLKFNEYMKVALTKPTNDIDYTFFPEDFPELEKVINDSIAASKKCISIEGAEDRARSIELIQLKFLKMHRKDLKDLATNLFQKFEGPEVVEEYHQELRNVLNPLSTLSMDSIGPDVFEIRTREIGESIFTELITPYLIASLNKEIIKERKMSSSATEQDTIKINQGKSEIKEEKLLSNTDENNVNETGINESVVQNKTVDIVSEMTRLNSPAKSPIKSSKKSSKKSSPKAVKKPIKGETISNEPTVRLKIRQYRNKNSGASPYWKWVGSLPENQRKTVLAQVENFKDRQKNGKSLGDSIYEIRVRQFELRVYFKYTNKNEITLISGGNKASQASDIVDAKAVAKNL
ncbi:MAG: hypothetical protein JHC93_08250 [Parachlamydiales bacterium]|nr:hypothetical protein [Parachlamydiales bacterium]